MYKQKIRSKTIRRTYPFHHHCICQGKQEFQPGTVNQPLFPENVIKMKRKSDQQYFAYTSINNVINLACDIEFLNEGTILDTH